MLTFFRTNQFLTSITFFFYLFLLRGIVLFFPEQYEMQLEPNGVLGEVLHFWSSYLPSWGNWLLVYLLLITQAIYISAIFSKHRIITDHILIPGATYLLVCSIVLPLQGFSTILIGNIFLIAAFDQLISTYRNTNASKQIFNVGFWIAVASLCYAMNFIFLLAAIIGLVSLRAFKLQEILMLLSGVFVVYLLVFTYYYWFDQLDYLRIHQFESNFAFFDFSEVTMAQFASETAIVFILLATVLLAYGYLMKKRTIQFQKKVGVMYILLFITLLTLLFQSNLTTHHYGILTFPIGILLGLVIHSMNPSSAEIFHLFLFIIVLIWTCSPLWLVA